MDYSNYFFFTGLFIVIFLLIGYLLGSLNFAIVLSKYFFNNDIRNHGSFNAGATNIKRTYGIYFAFFVGLCDVTKTIFAMSIAIFIEYVFKFETFAKNLPQLFLFAGLGAGLGHCFPLYYKFKGGKGVVTFFTTIGFFNIYFCLFLLFFFLIFLFITKYVGISSVFVAIVSFFNIAFDLEKNEFFVEYVFFNNDSPIIDNIVVYFFSFLVILRHINNIKFYFNWIISKEFKLFSKPEKFEKIYLLTDLLIKNKNIILKELDSVKTQNIEKNKEELNFKTKQREKNKYLKQFKLKKKFLSCTLFIKKLLILVKSLIISLKKQIFTFFKFGLNKKKKKFSFIDINKKNKNLVIKETEKIEPLIEEKEEISKTNQTVVEEKEEISKKIQPAVEEKEDLEEKKKKIIPNYKTVSNEKNLKDNIKGFEREQEFFSNWEKFLNWLKTIFKN